LEKGVMILQMEGDHMASLVARNPTAGTRMERTPSFLAEEDQVAENPEENSTA
jgi:hypothetical protein